MGKGVPEIGHNRDVHQYSREMAVPHLGRYVKPGTLVISGVEDNHSSTLKRKSA